MDVRSVAPQDDNWCRKTGNGGLYTDPGVFPEKGRDHILPTSIGRG